MTTNILDDLRSDFEEARIEHFNIADYLNHCRTDHMAYASAAERMVKAIGEPERIDTSLDPRLSRIFLNRTVRRYPAFKDFYGMEDTVKKLSDTTSMPLKVSKSASKFSICLARSAAASHRLPSV